LPTKAVTVTTAQTAIVGYNSLRRVLTIQNIDAADYVDISTKDAAVGIRIYPGGSHSFYRELGDEPEKRWNGVSDGAAEVRVYQAFDKEYHRPTQGPRPNVRGATGGHAKSGDSGGTGGKARGSGGFLR